MLQREIDKIFKELPNVFDIADDILVVDMRLMARTMMKQYEGYYRYADRLN